MATDGCLGVVELLTDEADRLEAAMVGLDGNPYGDFERFFGRTGSLAPAVPERVFEALDLIRGHRGPAALLIRGLPIPASVPSTPLEPFHATAMAAAGTESLLVALGSRLGEPFGYPQWDGGHLVHNKYPIPSHRDVQYGSNAVEFFLHTETPFRDVSPDFLALLCVRGDPVGLAKTRVAPIGEVVDELTEEQRDLLRQPLYAFETDTPVRVIDGRGLTEPLPILTEHDGRPLLEYVENLTAVDEKARELLTELRARLAERAVDVALDTGDLLVLDNFRVVHGRNAIEPRYDGTDRWLQRVLITNRLLVPGAGRMVEDRRYAHYPAKYREIVKPTA
jgi:L-asparagine oxygenase